MSQSRIWNPLETVPKNDLKFDQQKDRLVDSASGWNEILLCAWRL